MAACAREPALSTSGATTNPPAADRCPAERSRHRASEAQDGRSERPATGHGQPRAADHHQPAASRPVGFHAAGLMRVGRAHRLTTCATSGSEGLPVPGSRRCRQAEPWMAERSRHRASEAQEGRSERPATGHRQPRAARHHQPAASRPVGFHVAETVMRVGKTHRLTTCATRAKRDQPIGHGPAASSSSPPRWVRS